MHLQKFEVVLLQVNHITKVSRCFLDAENVEVDVEVHRLSLIEASPRDNDGVVGLVPLCSIILRSSSESSHCVVNSKSESVVPVFTRMIRVPIQPSQLQVLNP